MPLTDAQPRNAKPKDNPYKLTDGQGLYLLVNTDGAKYWRMNYRYGGKERTLAFGKYPQVTLAEARNKRAAARKLIDEGIDVLIPFTNSPDSSCSLSEHENTKEKRIAALTSKRSIIRSARPLCCRKENYSLHWVSISQSLLLSVFHRVLCFR